MSLTLPPELLTGIASVDEQHRAMVELHNEIATGLTGDRPAYFVIEALARLYQYSRQHFESEEKLMLRYGFEGLDDHRREHAELLDRLREVVLQYRSQPDTVPGKIQEFVRVWVVRHIEEADMQFAAPVREAMERERQAMLA